MAEHAESERRAFGQRLACQLDERATGEHDARRPVEPLQHAAGRVEDQLHRAGHRGVAGIVIDGAVRDAAEIREFGFPCFARAVVPSGPHKGFGGTIDGRISCAGCPVAPGDIVLGDDDGIAVVPIERWRRVYDDCLKKLEQEEGWLKQLDAGGSMVEILGLPEAEIVET